MLSESDDAWDGLQVVADQVAQEGAVKDLSEAFSLAKTRVYGPLLEQLAAAKPSENSAGKEASSPTPPDRKPAPPKAEYTLDQRARMVFDKMEKGTSGTDLKRYADGIKLKPGKYQRQ